MTIGVLLRLGRVSNLPTVWSNVIAALVLAGAVAEPRSLTLLLSGFSLFYVGGMYLNDAFDRKIDALERPDRPIPSGVISASSVFAIGFSILAAGVGLVSWCASEQVPQSWTGALLGGLALAAMIVLYDIYHKNNPLSPLLMGLCRVLVYVTAALAMTASVAPRVQLGAVALLCHLIGLTYAAKQENLARLTSVWPLLFLAVTPVVGVVAAQELGVALAFVVLLCAWLVHSLRFLFHNQRRSIPQAIVRLIAGIALVDAALIATLEQFGLALAAVGCCALTRILQRYVPGT